AAVSAGVTVKLADLAAPEHTAVVTQECQGAVMGPNAGLAVLASEARREALPNIVRLLPAARAAGVRIVHCLVQRRRGPAARTRAGTNRHGAAPLAWRRADGRHRPGRHPAQPRGIDDRRGR